MNAAKSKENNGILLTLEQTMALSNLGKTKVREIAKESMAERKIGRCYRIDKSIFFDYIDKVYSTSY